MPDTDAARPIPSSTLQRVHLRAQVVVRYLLAFFFITYGTAKLLGTQFIRSGMTLDHPISELSGFELTWAYFGYSLLYSHFIALGQITFAAMLLFDRTARIGMLGLFPIILNIVLVNFAYRISTATTIVSCVFLAMNVYLVLSQFGSLKRFFWDEAVTARRSPQPAWRTLAVPAMALAAFTVGTATLLTLMKRHFMAETPLTGDWVVHEFHPDGSEEAAHVEALAWEKVYFGEGGSFGVRAAGGMMHGRYVVDPEPGHLEIRYHPYPSRRGAPAPAPADTGSASAVVPAPARLEDALTASLSGRFHLAPDRSRLIIRGTGADQPFELVLVPWVWPRF